MINKLSITLSSNNHFHIHISGSVANLLGVAKQDTWFPFLVDTAQRIIWKTLWNLATFNNVGMFIL